MNFDISSFCIGMLLSGALIFMVLIIIALILAISEMDNCIVDSFYDDKTPDSIEEIQMHYKRQYCTVMVNENITSKRLKKRLIKIINRKYQKDVDRFKAPNKINEMLKNISI